jgi:archaellum component FlaC
MRFCDETRKELEEYIECIKEQVECLSSKISSYGALLINTYIPFMDKYFNEHEIIQIIGGSYEQCKRIKEFYDKNCTGTESLTDSFIIHHGEYR